MPMAVCTGIMIIIGICINFIDVMPIKVMGTRTTVTVAVSFLTVIMLFPPTLIYYENDVRKQCQNVKKNNASDFIKVQTTPDFDLMLSQEPVESYLYRNYTNFISDWLILFFIAFVLWVCVAAIISAGMSDLK